MLIVYKVINQSNILQYKIVKKVKVDKNFRGGGGGGFKCECYFAIFSDVRSTAPELTGTFSERSEEYFQKFITYAGSDSTEGMPYLHYLRSHVGNLMVFYSRFGWGYGMFNCNASEHLNKLIKFSEINETNLDSTRFLTIIRLMRLQQFILTDSVIPKKKAIICSVCKIPEHNKKNKSCPLHPSHPPIQFDESDEEVV